MHQAEVCYSEDIEPNAEWERVLSQLSMAFQYAPDSIQSLPTDVEECISVSVGRD